PAGGGARRVRRPVVPAALPRVGACHRGLGGHGAKARSLSLEPFLEAIRALGEPALEKSAAIQLECLVGPAVAHRVFERDGVAPTQTRVYSDGVGAAADDDVA